MFLKVNANKCTLPLFMLFAGFLSVIFGKELCWDLANYHYYVPYAYFHHRELIDQWPGSYIHQYLNPTIDFLTYGLITFLSPKMAEFSLGAIDGIAIWILYLICLSFSPARHKYLVALLLTLLGVWGPTALSGIGSFQNDMVVCIFILGCVYFQIQFFQQNKFIYLMMSGVLLGIGLGLKLIAGIYLIGALGAFLFLSLRWHERIKIISLFSMAVLLGALVSAGFWWWHMWVLHGNPVLPAFNNIFHSPDFALTNWRDTRFLPKNIMQTLFFPFYFSWDGRTADAPFRDIRFIWVYLLFAVYMIYFLFSKPKPLNISTKWLFGFYIMSYLVWQFYFSMARYLMALELLAPLIIYLIICEFNLKLYLKFSIVFIIYYSVMVLLIPTPMIRTPRYGQSYFNVKLPASIVKENEATVLIAYSVYAMYVDPRPQSYLIPFFPSSWKFVGLPCMNGKVINMQGKLENQHQYYVLAPDKLIASTTAFRYSHCEKIMSDRQAITHEDVLLCKIK